MLFQKTLYGLGLLASLASAAPSLRRRQDASGLNVVYWGQNGGGTIENNDLSAYCTATSDIDVLVLSSLWQWSNGATAMGGSFGQSVCSLYSLFILYKVHGARVLTVL
jgi:chitinase